MSAASEPRTTTDIIQDLYDFAVAREWSGQVNTNCHCHPEYTDACPECCAKVPDEGDAEHRPGCKLAALLRETEAFLEAEHEMERALSKGKHDVCDEPDPGS